MEQWPDHAATGRGRKRPSHSSSNVASPLSRMHRAGPGRAGGIDHFRVVARGFAGSGDITGFYVNPMSTERVVWTGTTHCRNRHALKVSRV